MLCLKFHRHFVDLRCSTKMHFWTLFYKNAYLGTVSMVASEHKPSMHDPTEQTEIAQKSLKFIEALPEVCTFYLKYLVETLRPG